MGYIKCNYSNAVSIDELTKPRPTASQNTRRREQRQPQLSPNQQYVQINPVANEPNNESIYSTNEQQMMKKTHQNYIH